MKISGNTVFIPGATSGIGLALALALRDKGNNVIVGGRRQELLDQIVAEHPPDVHAVRIDTADPDSITAVAAQVLTAHPDLNVVITMAGVMSIEDWHHPRDLPGVGRIDHHHQRARPDPTDRRVHRAPAEPAGGHGDDRLLGGAGGFTPLRVTPSYNASKAAIHLLTETLRLQFAGSSVEFKELVPPAVKTDLVPGQRDSEWAMPLEDFVREVVDILEKQPEATEIQVENVKFLRYAEVRGEYEHAIAVLNSADPHAS